MVMMAATDMVGKDMAIVTVREGTTSVGWSMGSCLVLPVSLLKGVKP